MLVLVVLEFMLVLLIAMAMGSQREGKQLVFEPERKSACGMFVLRWGI